MATNHSGLERGHLLTGPLHDGGHRYLWFVSAVRAGGVKLLAKDSQGDLMESDLVTPKGYDELRRVALRYLGRRRIGGVRMALPTHDRGRGVNALGQIGEVIVAVFVGFVIWHKFFFKRKIQKETTRVLGEYEPEGEITVRHLADPILGPHRLLLVNMPDADWETVTEPYKTGSRPIDAIPYSQAAIDAVQGAEYCLAIWPGLGTVVVKWDGRPRETVEANWYVPDE